MTRFAASSPQITNFLTKSPKYDAIGNMDSEARSSERRTSTELEGATASTGLDSMGQIKSAGHAARATIAQGQAAAAGTRAQGFSSMMGSIAGGIGSMDFGSPGIGTGSAFGEVGTAGSDMSSFGYSAADDIAFNNGTGIDYGWL